MQQIKVVRFDQSVNKGREGSSLKYRNNGKGKAARKAMDALNPVVLYPRKTAAKVYEALAQSNNEKMILKECRDNAISNVVVRIALKDIIPLTDAEGVQSGLKRLQEHEKKRCEATGNIAVTADNVIQQVGANAANSLLKVDRFFPALVRTDESSSLSSGDMVMIDINTEVSDEESLFKYVLEQTFGIAKDRGLEREDFVAKAREIFQPVAEDIFKSTLAKVVPEDYEPNLISGAGTADSDIDALRVTAGNACQRWCKASGKTDHGPFYMAIFS